MNRSDTIIAPATPPGEGGLAVIRISGPQAREALQRFFRPSGRPAALESHRLYHGYLQNATSQPLDEIMAVYMQPPRSYTCEEVVEIHCHGGQQVTRAILDLFLHHGLRLACPGEFTYRAFMNGRLDLAQAEAVSRLIHSRSEAARALALSQVEGRLSRAIVNLAKRLRRILVLVEAWIDFPEEEIPTKDNQYIISQVSEIVGQIDVLLDSYMGGRALTEGASILLTGRPNVGKSSLLNALLGEERAIVTEIPGTTRDILEEGLTIGGVPVRLIDTAGLRQTADPIEREGVRRAHEKLVSADLVLFLVDGSTPVAEEDLFAYHACRGKAALLVATKADLVSKRADTDFCNFPRIDISSKTGAGLDQLRQAMAAFFIAEGVEPGETVMLTEQRHNDALLRCRQSLVALLGSLDQQASLEFLSIDLRGALSAIGEISGETTTDDILKDIFNSFCVGK